MNTQKESWQQRTSFRQSTAIVRSLRWGFVVTVLLAASSFVPVLQLIPFCIFMATAAFLSFFAPMLSHFIPAGGSFSEIWVIAAAVLFCTLIFAALRLVHLIFLHQLPSSKDGHTKFAVAQSVLLGRRSNHARLSDFPRALPPIASYGLRMIRLLALCTLAASFLTTVRAETLKEHPELAAAFKKTGVVGTFVMLDPSDGTLHVHDAERAKKRFTPASTFKIPNSLIGLDCGAVKDVDEVLPYGGKPQMIKEWEKDMGLRDAIKISNVPVYQELARRIGLERMKAGVKKLAYGNQEIGTVVDRFWLDGPLAISAVEQVDFLKRLAKGELAVSQKAMEDVREITMQEKTDGYRLHAKTGWAQAHNPAIGWYVGWLERGGSIYPFALNIDMPSLEDAPKRAVLAKQCLRLLRKIE